MPFVFPNFHRLLESVNAEPVVGDLDDLVPRETGWVFDRLLKLRGAGAVGHHVEPVAFAAVLGDATLVGRQQNAAGGGGETFYLNQAQLAGRWIEAGYIVANIFLVDIFDLTTLRGLVLHDHPHCRHLSFGMGAQAPDIEGLAFGMGQDQDAGEPLDALQGQCPLPIELIAPTVAACHDLGMAGFGLRQAALSTDYVVIPLLGGAANLLIGPLDNLRQGQFDVSLAMRSTSASRSARTSLIKGTKAFSLSQAVASGRAATDGRSPGVVAGTEIAEDIWLAEAGSAAVRQLHGE